MERSRWEWELACCIAPPACLVAVGTQARDLADGDVSHIKMELSLAQFHGWEKIQLMHHNFWKVGGRASYMYQLSL